MIDSIFHYFYLEIQKFRWDQGPGRLSPFSSKPHKSCEPLALLPGSSPVKTNRERPSDVVLCTERGTGAQNVSWERKGH